MLNLREKTAKYHYFQQMGFGAIFFSILVVCILAVHS
jgi:hypothetical protein